ncbi:enoyl-CoA hydratase/isomerase family protein [bacterium]|nr:enoyl-CoA hydratase/isomerase family protein [bacterium]
MHASALSAGAEFGPALYTGPQGYASLTPVSFSGRSGFLLHYRNPDPRKLHAVDSQGMRELSEALAALESTVAAGDALVASAVASGEPHPEADELASFCVIHGDYDPVHAGADITEFAGDPDYSAIHQHMLRGVDIDTRIKKLWPRLRTVGVYCGERFGGSVEWPMFAQWAVCDSRTRIQYSEVQLGIVPGWDGILNSLLHSTPLNAEYMCATGNPLTAQQMFSAGFVQGIVDAPAPPDRAAIPPEEYPQAWKHYAAQRQAELLLAALTLACSAELHRPQAQDLVSPEAMHEEIRRRSRYEAYAALRDQIAAEAAALAPADAEGLKALNRKAAAEVAKLGKPLAPLAVSGVQDFIERWRGLDNEELLSRFHEIGTEEAALIDRLMQTEHRRVGVNAVLSKNPAERVAVFD